MQVVVKKKETSWLNCWVYQKFSGIAFTNLNMIWMDFIGYDHLITYCYCFF